MNAPSRPVPTLLSALLLILALSSCGRAPLAPGPDTAEVSATLPAPGGAATRGVTPGTIDGEIGGARFELSVPEDWNGDLVVYAHGYTAPIYPVGVPPGEEPLLEGLRALALQSGIAFAWSSYSETGLGFRDAALRTDQLLQVFRSRVGPTRRTFLIGVSFGGLVAVKLAETRPSSWDGVLTLCGMTGGLRAELQYVGHVRALFDHFYGDAVLPGNVCELDGFDARTDLQAFVDTVTARVIAHPEYAFMISQVTQTPLPYSTNEELVTSLIQALVLHAVEVEDLLERTHGQCFFDNSQTVYTGNLPAEVLADLNARVERYTATPAARMFVERSYEPTGDLQVPLITMHTTMDPVVPVFHQALYRAKVEEAGRLQLLHEITVSRYGHLQFMPAELGAAFQQLLGFGGAPLAAGVDR